MEGRKSGQQPVSDAAYQQRRYLPKGIYHEKGAEDSPTADRFQGLGFPWAGLPVKARVVL